MNKPRVGFLGTGWIGRHRMAAICESGHAVAAAVTDPDQASCAMASAIAPAARTVSSLAEMLTLGLDGVVIATPSALHAEHALAALGCGAAVFSQKPLGRNADEVEAVVTAAKAANRLFAGDFCYRHTAAVTAVKNLVDKGALGGIFAVEMEFHNAYGPDKPWFYDPKQSGGGCMMDLGIHLVDLLLWMFDFPEVTGITSRLYREGHPLPASPSTTEDYAAAQLDIDRGLTARLACSWRLHAGHDAVIGARIYGTRGGAAIRNVNGSFYDFEAAHWQGTSSEILISPPDDWGGRAAVKWARELAEGARFDKQTERYCEVAEVVDRIYRGS